jgi:hypothetical protein
MVAVGSWVATSQDVNLILECLDFSSHFMMLTTDLTNVIDSWLRVSIDERASGK